MMTEKIPIYNIKWKSREKKLSTNGDLNYKDIYKWELEKIYPYIGY